MKLSDYKGEEALDVLAELIEPAVEIASDKEISEAIKRSETRARGISLAIKKHKKAVIRFLATLEREEPEKYTEKINLFTLPVKLLEILNEPELNQLFFSQGQMGDATSSGSASENIGE